MRAFLRPPSTPWIVFDRETKAEIGRMLTSGRSSILPDTGVFAEAVAAAPPEGPVDPSNVVVATDIEGASELAERDEDDVEIVVLPRPRRRLAIASAGVGALALLACVAIAVAPKHDSAPKTEAATATPTAVVAATPNADVIPAPPPTTTSAEEPPPPPTGAARAVEPAAPKFGKLTIRGSATRRHVFLDGKRLLGSGKRTFVVFCGAHTVGIGDRKNQSLRDVDVPCNGELVVDR